MRDTDYPRPTPEKVAVAIADRLVGRSDFADHGEVWVQGFNEGCFILGKFPQGGARQKHDSVRQRLADAIARVLQEEKTPEGSP